MKIKSAFVFAGIVCTVYMMGCQSEPSAPTGNNMLNEPLTFETVDNDLALMKGGGMSLGDAAGVFSIGWNEMFRPFEQNSEVKGMAFAAAFGDRETDLRHFNRFGLDMGNVFISYSGNNIEMHKRIHEVRGTVYNLFERPFGNCNPDNMLEFIPSTEYKFEVTGSEVFAPVTISLMSPSALMDITNHNSGDIIDPASDLLITWTGGKADGKTAVRLMPHLRPQRGSHEGPGNPPHHPPFDRIIFVVLETNTGSYTFPSEQIQRLLNGIEADGLVMEVSQVDLGEVEHPNGILKTAMKNGSSVMLRIQ